MKKMEPKQLDQSSSLNCMFSEDELDNMDEILSQNDSPIKCPPLSEITEDCFSVNQIEQQNDQQQRINQRHKNTVQLVLDVNMVNQQIQKNARKAHSKEFIKELVSKQKNRFQLDGFNLDLTCNLSLLQLILHHKQLLWDILQTILSHYEVQRFLNTRHPEKYKVINLCSERQYRHDLFYKVVEFPFEDHQPPPFQIILPFCLTVSKWLKKQDRVVAVHCKAGKGRTGTMISCYLLYSKQYDSSKDALKYYAMIRTQNQEGVTIPSQARYVEYFNIALKMNLLYVPAKTVELIEVRLVGIPNFGIFGGCKPFIRIQNENKQLIQQPTILTNQDQQKQYSAIFKFQGVYLSGDVVVQFFHKSIVLEEKMFQAWLNTSFVIMSPQLQIFQRDELDGVGKDKQFKKFPINFSLEILFDKVVAIRRRSDCIK
ncbi:unnamed protein product [Paramecium octaurelia]|uniref:Phosphatidylinositol-3,4,5-trisphosphate 3-phosphatase n=1 Tax=Paramecium octaurelia TaxID=43137 RepID=A0A8S1S7Y7_PAROT|nr:unnamed protein product [Paramecium octaurelia]